MGLGRGKMENNNQIQIIESKIFTIRGQQVMLDRDLAELYQVETKYLNRVFKRNINRFFDDYFQLKKIELNQLVTNCHRLQKLKHSSSMPYAFKLEGILQFSSILNSQIAITTNRHIMGVFIKYNGLISQDINNELLHERLKRLEAETKLFNAKAETIHAEMLALKSDHKIDINVQNMEINDLNEKMTELLTEFNKFRDSSIIIKKDDGIGRG